MKELTLINYLLGDASPAKWGAMMILSIAMAAVMMFNRVKARDTLSFNTPIKFSWRFFLADTTGRILSTVISIFLLTRVLLVYIKPEYVIVYSIIVGLISDQLPVIFVFAKEKIIDRVKVLVNKWFSGNNKSITKRETIIQDENTQQNT